MKKVLSIIMVVGLLILPLSLSFAYAERDYTTKFFDCNYILNMSDDEIVKVFIRLDTGIEDKDAFDAEVEEEIKAQLGYNKADLPEFPSGPADAEKEENVINARREIQERKLKEHYDNVIASLNIAEGNILRQDTLYNGQKMILIEDTVGKIKEIAQSDYVTTIYQYVIAVDDGEETDVSGNVPTDNFIKADFKTGADKDSTEGKYGYFGPYSDKNMMEMSTTDGLIFNLAVKDSWVTTEIAPQEMRSYQYATLVIRTDDTTAIKGFTMTIGGKGKAWEDWTNYDGKGAPPLTTDYQIISLDLFASGVNDPLHNITGDGNNGPDFALNQGNATGGHIYVESITFQDYPPENAVGDGEANPTPMPIPEPEPPKDPRIANIPYEDVTIDEQGVISYHDDEGNYIVIAPDGSTTYYLITGDVYYITKDGEGSYHIDPDGNKEYLPLEGNGNDEPAVDGVEPITKVSGGTSDKSDNNKSINNNKSNATPNPNTGVEGITVALVIAITACGALAITSKKR